MIKIGDTIKSHIDETHQNFRLGMITSVDTSHATILWPDGSQLTCALYTLESFLYEHTLELVKEPKIEDLL